MASCSTAISGPLLASEATATYVWYQFRFMMMAKSFADARRARPRSAASGTRSPSRTGNSPACSATGVHPAAGHWLASWDGSAQ